MRDPLCARNFRFQERPAPETCERAPGLPGKVVLSPDEKRCRANRERAGKDDGVPECDRRGHSLRFSRAVRAPSPPQPRRALQVMAKFPLPSRRTSLEHAANKSAASAKNERSCSFMVRNFLLWVCGIGKDAGGLPFQFALMPGAEFGDLVERFFRDDKGVGKLADRLDLDSSLGEVFRLAMFQQPGRCPPIAFVARLFDCLQPLQDATGDCRLNLLSENGARSRQAQKVGKEIFAAAHAWTNGEPRPSAAQIIRARSGVWTVRRPTGRRRAGGGAGARISWRSIVGSVLILPSCVATRRCHFAYYFSNTLQTKAFLRFGSRTNRTNERSYG